MENSLEKIAQPDKSALVERLSSGRRLGQQSGKRDLELNWSRTIRAVVETADHSISGIDNM